MVVTVCFLVVLSTAQSIPSTANMPQQSDPDMQNMPGMNQNKGKVQVSGMKMENHGGAMESHSLIEFLQQHPSSGTDAEPNSTPLEMLMTTWKNWTFMFHGEAC